MVAKWGEAQKFFQEIVLRSDGDSCLIWPYARDGSGYAHLLRRGRKTRGVHRLACECVNGPPPTDKHQAAHTCGNGHLGCVNPKHVIWKTPSENQKDRAVHGTSNRGERCARAVLNRNDVEKIRSLRGRILQRIVANEFGISVQQVSRIQRGDRWGWLST